MNRFLNLEPDHFAHLRGGSRLCVTQGLLWLTIDGETDDLLLARGQGLTVPHDRRALAQALGSPARALVASKGGWRERVLMAWHALAGHDLARVAA